MSGTKSGWTNVLRCQGSSYLAWVTANRILEMKFEMLAAALWTLWRDTIRTPEDAYAVWRAIPAVLSRCDEQST